MRAALTILLLALLASPAGADGLIYRLPPDGTAAVFELESTTNWQGKDTQTRGTLAVRSVGREAVKGELCRWVEVDVQTRTDTDKDRLLYKVLIPEKALAGGRATVEDVRRCWYLRREGNAKLLDKHPQDERWGPLPLLLFGPPKDLKKVGAVEIDSPLGKLKCAGESGRFKFTQESRNWEVDYVARVHERAPFGVVELRMALKQNRQGRLGTVAQTLKLVEVQKDVRGQLPDSR